VFHIIVPESRSEAAKDFSSVKNLLATAKKTKIAAIEQIAEKNLTAKEDVPKSFMDEAITQTVNGG